VAPALFAVPVALLELVVRGVGLWSYAAGQLGSRSAWSPRSRSEIP